MVDSLEVGYRCTWGLGPVSWTEVILCVCVCVCVCVFVCVCAYICLCYSLRLNTLICTPPSFPSGAYTCTYVYSTIRRVLGRYHDTRALAWQRVGEGGGGGRGFGENERKKRKKRKKKKKRR